MADQGLPRDETWDSPGAESLCTTFSGKGKLWEILLINYTRQSFSSSFHLLEASAKVMFIALGFLKGSRMNTPSARQARQRWEQECLSAIPNDIKSSLGCTEVSESSLAWQGSQEGLNLVLRHHNLLFLPDVIKLLLQIPFLLSVSHHYWDISSLLTWIQFNCPIQVAYEKLFQCSSTCDSSIPKTELNIMGKITCSTSLFNNNFSS